MSFSPGITLLGLGPGDPGLLTKQAWELLESNTEIYLRTRQHPTVAGLPAHLTVYDFDHVYEEEVDTTAVYSRIVEEVLALGRRPSGVVYAVPGHPFVAEATGSEIARRADSEGLPLRVVEGLSFVEPVLTALRVDPLPHTALMDALELAATHHPTFPPSAPALIAQVYSRAVAAEVKLTLMAAYPDEHEVQFVHNAGTIEFKIENLPLHEIDHSEQIGLLTSLYIPPLAPNTSFEDFQELIAHLRSPEGCPWDREQTHQTLRRNLLEEAHETLAALDADDPDAMREELGDLLLQIVLHAQIAAEYGEFTMSDVIQGIHTKLVKRHPHVFGDLDLDDPEAVIQNWERLKALERGENGEEDNGLLAGVPTSLPALAQAETYQRRAARVGFDWPGIEGVLDKIIEEVREVRQAENAPERATEIGDLLFALVNLARWYDVDPEAELRQANGRFRQRFEYIEAVAQEQGRELSSMTLEEMDKLWEQAKKGD